MTLRDGYSYATVRANVAELLASGHEKPRAWAIAKCQARIAFFRKFPGGYLPGYLTAKGGGRHRGDYTSSGAPRAHRSKQTLIGVSGDLFAHNPTRRAVKQAAKLIQDFSGHNARILGKVPAPKIPKVAIAIGYCLGISYETKRDGRMEKYYHRFTRKSARPLLAVSNDGKQLFLLGGAYDFTERGIVDRVK